MRILVGNAIDSSIRQSSDVSAYVQRILWFAHDGDSVVLPKAPDPEFLAHVAYLTGLDPNTLRFYVAGPRLDDPGLVAALSEVRDRIDEIFPLWPSALVARLAGALDLLDRLPGAEFMAQGGGELSNSKANFRALAVTAGVRVPSGAVCRDLGEAAVALAETVRAWGGAVVKQAHNGSGNGNQLVLPDDLSTGHVGARHLHVIEPGRAAVDDYWARRWDWASAGGRYPVVIEAFVPGARSVYTEHYVGDTGVRPTGAGVLDYAERRLAAQVVPLRPPAVSDRTLESLIRQGAKLAETYRAIGYSGYLSADALVDPAGDVWFTEVNAQVSGSLHLYQVIGDEIVRAEAQPKRTVSEFDVPETWGVTSVRQLLVGAEQARVLYDPNDRTGVIVTTPPGLLTSGRADFMFCVAYEDDEQRDAILNRLDRQFAGAARTVSSA